MLDKNKQLLNFYANNMFSEFRGIDLLEIISIIENTSLTYRDSLNLPRNVTFGVEIEYENLEKKIVDKYVSENLKKWDSKSDTSVSHGGEVASDILNDSKTDWNNLKKICEFLKKKSVIYNGTAGGHIHIDKDILNNDVDSWRLFFKTYCIYENILFRFGYNDRVGPRKGIKTYASNISVMFYDSLLIFKEEDWKYKLIKKMGYDKDIAVNFQNVRFDDSSKKRNTIEFRFPNGTFEEIIWQNNINAFTKILLSSKNKTIDEEFLDYKINNNEIAFKYDKNSYNEIDLRNALEFVDLIFDNNLDKIYFLRQYFKDFTTCFGKENIVKAKRFVK